MNVDREIELMDMEFKQVDFVIVALGLIFIQYTIDALETICIVSYCALLVYDPLRINKKQHWMHNFAGAIMVLTYVDIIMLHPSARTITVDQIMPTTALEFIWDVIILLQTACTGLCIGTLVKQRKDVKIGSLAGCTYVVALFYTIYSSYPNFFMACLLALICGCIGIMLLVYKREYVMSLSAREMNYICSGIFLFCPHFQWLPPSWVALTSCAIDIFVYERHHIRATWIAPSSILVLLIYIIIDTDLEFIIIMAAVSNIVGCIYIMNNGDYNSSSVFWYAMSQMIIVICKMLCPEPIVQINVVVGCLGGVGASLFQSQSKFNIKEDLTMGKVLFLASNITGLLSMWLQLRGVCVIVSIFVFPSVWVLIVVGTGRMSVLHDLGKVWDKYDCEHGTLSDFPFTGISCSFVVDIINEFNIQKEPYIQDENTLDFQNSAILYLQIIERLSDNGTLENIGVDERKKISLCLLRLGTNSLLASIARDDSIRGNVILYAMFILMFENVPPNGEITAKEVMSIARSVAELDVRGITKFYSKRISCSCLEKKYKSYHKALKHVRCHKCRLVKRPKELFMCTGCMTRQYCCKDCQRTDWEGGHKVSCKDIARSMTRCLIVGRSECSD